jgi:hypothetical protein
MLQAGAGAALLHTATHLKAMLGLPEIVERELKPQHDRATRDAIKKTASAIRVLSDWWGRKISIEFPSEREIRNSLDNQLSRLESMFHRVPLTMGQVQKAIDCIIDHKPPSGSNNEQFRDTVIWQAVLDLGKGFDVIFITDDRAFYLEKDPKKGLAPNLLEEAAAAGKITCYPSIEMCLTELHQEIVPDDGEQIAKQIAAYLESDSAFTLERLKQRFIYAFKTDKPVLALSYTLVFDVSLTHARTSSVTDTILEVSGECEYDPETKTISNMIRRSEEVILSGLGGVENKYSVYPPLFRPSDYAIVIGGQPFWQRLHWDSNHREAAWDNFVYDRTAGRGYDDPISS